EGAPQQTGERIAALRPQRFYEILTDSLELLRTTTNPDTFFGRYKDALKAAAAILNTEQAQAYRAEAEQVCRNFLADREKPIREFVDRCAEKGILYVHRDAIVCWEGVISEELADYIDARCAEQLPAADEGVRYKYCAVMLDKSGRCFYYRTEDMSLRCGDDVIVPVGEEGKRAVGKIKRIELCTEATAPYPLSQTKWILSKYMPEV
ncbi:MAG: hypothetical protein IIY04_04670, partial [Oscillospiraceae bacterium]|nr:hypothetical protein [Oscillospiraceae bacterium]